MKLENNEQNVITAAFKNSVSDDAATSLKAKEEIVQAIELPLRKALLSGDTIGGVFSPMAFSENQPVMFPLDILTPGQEKEFAAYVVPDAGRIPERRVEGDYIMIPTYDVANSVDATLKFIRNANWPVVQRMLEVLEAGFRKKLNDDAWQTVISAATDRNILVNDPNASVGQFTPRLITLMSTFMRRNGGGNTGSTGRSKLTDIYLSPEALMDIRAWGLDLVPDAIRAMYYNTPDGADVLNVLGVKLHALDELGEGQDYQTYYGTTLGGSMASTDVEILIGLDLQTSNSFVMPVTDELKIYEDNTTHRRGIFSLYGRMGLGFGVLDSRRTLLSSI